MNCHYCQGGVTSGSRFCKECGAAVPFLCQNCDHQIEPSSKFCSECGAQTPNAVLSKNTKLLATNNSKNKARITLDETFIIEMNRLYYFDILNRIGRMNHAEDFHSKVNIFNSADIKDEFMESLKKLRGHFARSFKIPHDEYHLNSKLQSFITNDCSALFQYLSRLSIVKEEVLTGVSNSSTEGFLKRAAAGAAAGAVTGSIIPGLGTFIGGLVGAAAGWVAGEKIETNEKNIAERYQSTFEGVVCEVDVIWVRLTDLMEEFAERYNVDFEINEEKLRLALS